MATYFLDSSAVVKIYANETGTRWIRQLAGAGLGNTVLFVQITGVEVISAIARRLRGGNLTPAQGTQALQDFRHDFANEFRVMEVSPSLLQLAMILAEAHALRGYDAVQLASAVQVNGTRAPAGLTPITLISSDTELNAAAVTEGLPVDDPNAHP